MNLLISTASAQTGSAAGGFDIANILLMVLLFVVFYFLLIRPQQKKQKEHKAMVDGLTKNDEVVTMGGLLGKITEVGDHFITVSVAEGIEVKVQRGSVQALMPKGTIKN